MTRPAPTDGLTARLTPRLAENAGQSPVLSSVHIAGELRGLLFEARVVQQFHNPGDRPLEVVYAFPLPWGAVLMGVTVVLGGRHLSGAVVETIQAQTRYEAALAEGDAAILLEKNADQTYTLNLGNLAADETCTITIRYAQMLSLEQGGLRLSIPTVIAPRFGDPITDSGLAPHQVPEHSLAVDHRFTVAIDLHDALADARVTSPSHAIGQSRDDPAKGQRLRVSLAQQDSLDRDFILVLDALPQRSATLLATDADHPGRIVAMLTLCPHIPASQPQPVRVKILIDCSGSMNGDSIESARQALQAVIAQFQTQDLFSLSRFGDTADHHGARLWPVSPRTRRAAQRWTDRLAADMGGTDMVGALGATFALPATEGCAVLMITDGEIEAIDKALRLASTAGHRLFIVGIGSSPAASHLYRLAEASGGACDFVAPGEAVMPAVLRMFARLRSPVVSDLVVEWPEGALPRWSMGPQGGVFDGDTVQICAMFDGTPPPGEVRLRGRYCDRDSTDTLASAPLEAPVQALDTVSRMAVAMRLQRLGIDRPGKCDPILIERAVTYQLLTSRTNFLLVHQRTEADKAPGMPELHKVAQMVPAGWHGIGSVKAEQARWRSGHAVMSPGYGYSAEYDQPAVWRSPRNPTTAAGRTVTRVGELEPPAFLRRQADLPLKPARQAARPPSAPGARRTAGKGTGDARTEIKASSAENRPGRQGPFDIGPARADVATPASPLGLTLWLTSQPVPDWPLSYAALAGVGLPSGLIAWLARSARYLVAGRQFEQTAVVQAFLFIMSLPETLTGLSGGEPLAEGHRLTDIRLPDWLNRAARSNEPPIDPELARAMLTALGETRADQWPPALRRGIGDASPQAVA